MRIFIIFSALILLFSSCFQTYNDDELNTTPVTNNPHIVPNHGGGLPNMPSFPQ